ncbi:MAG: hypothetical protein ACYSWU_25030, partial [Planctomycetota bacterium]
GVLLSERFKGLGGFFDANIPGRVTTGGLLGFVSADGVRWKRMRDKAVIGRSVYPFPTDTGQNCAFWSEHGDCYVCYIRTWKGEGKPIHPGWDGNIRWISRTVSKDYEEWSVAEPLVFGDTPPEHLYNNQAQPYFRAPHIYLSFPFRFLPERKVVPEHLEPGVSDGVFMSSRDGVRWDRTFLEAFVRPGRERENWTDRNNMVAWGVVPTAPDELSVYWVEHYRHPSCRLRRGTLRLDGFVSVNAPYAGGELVTHPLRFEGRELVLNYATSAAGSVRVELQNAAGRPLPGHTLAESVELYGDEIERAASWEKGSDLGQLAGQPVRLRFVMKDADLYSIRFRLEEVS